MVWSGANQRNDFVESLIKKILLEKQLTSKEHLQLTTAILSDYNLTDEMRQKINLIFDLLLDKTITIVNSDYK